MYKILLVQYPRGTKAKVNLEDYTGILRIPQKGSRFPSLLQGQFIEFLHVALIRYFEVFVVLRLCLRHGVAGPLQHYSG